MLWWVFLALLPATAGAAQLPPMDVPLAHDRILVVAPHPDDETLCCGGYVQRALAADAAVAIVWLTAGDGFTLSALLSERRLRLKGRGMQQLGALRLGEALEAGRRLGVPEEHLFLLGYPDRGVRKLLDPHAVTPWRSPYTLSRAIPYPAVLDPGSAYTGFNLERDLATVIDRFRPTRILVSAPEDAHPDHAGAPELLRRVLATQRHQADVRHYVIHAGRRWPNPRGWRPTLPMTAPPLPPGFAVRAWESFELTDAEQAGKRNALDAHRSQTRVMRPFLDAFVRRNELFAP